MRVYVVSVTHCGESEIEGVFSDKILAYDYIVEQWEFAKRRKRKSIAFKVEMFEVLDQIPKLESEED